MSRLQHPLKLLLAMYMLLISGCIHVEQELTLREDGRGELMLQFGIQRSVLEDVIRAAERGSPESVRPFDRSKGPLALDVMQLRETYASSYTHGLRLVDLTVAGTGEVQTLRLRFAFDHLDQLAADELTRSLGIRLEAKGGDRWALEQSALWEARGIGASTIAPTGFSACLRYVLPGTLTSIDRGERNGSALQFKWAGDEAATQSRRPIHIEFTHQGFAPATPPPHDRATSE